MERASPINPPKASDNVEVPIFTQKRPRMLAAQGRNPQVIRGDRFPRSFQF